MKKSICMIGSGVISIPPKFGGGIEIFIYEISKFISKKINSIIIDRKWMGEKSEEICNGIKFYRIEVPKFENVFLLRVTEFLLGLKAILRIRKIKPNVVHLHTTFTALPFAIFKFLMPKKLKRVYTCHNPAWTVPDAELDILNLIIEKIEKFVMDKFDFITADSRTSRACIITKSRIDPEKIFAIYNFVDIQKFSKRVKNWKSKHGIKGQIVLFVSKLTRAKGIEYFIKAIPLIKAKVKNVKFVIIGPVSFEVKTKNPWIELADRLGVLEDTIFLGAVSGKELPEIYSSADIFCLPTLRETFCIVLAEAMASGLPIVSSKLKAIEEITDGASLLVERKNVQELSKAVIKLLKSKRQRIALGRRALKRSKLFDKRSVLKKYLNFYKELENKM